ncbi:patatin-like phospholipase family protein [Streptantibioticus cattleyicolor]|uniref:Patatin n=1 Tax=Streptantibioticus cattleyicolor (strain ATCC 35852 / DSM 46488 / JCM 4925 / NBRC 14057 / NRRL 8057) TaxID=1003195 RepID=F8JLR4_STREN|nr:patatin-like phospholipase family protein [Streptantibioticus cattleyicolor]AEW99505.1 patatin [Streptantibioticus cattleyicolor NRRL 8057 = DSM 46488]CCB71454.1 Patatin [Streptantibioticus cattleyicolor NRRL 8057 = DSM 46488]
MSESDRILILGGGGVAGIAWATGLLTGLADQGNDVSRAGTVIGTSAGSAVGAQLGSGLSLEELYARQVDPALQAAEIAAEFDADAFAASFAAAYEAADSPEDQRRRLGRLALEAKTVPEAERRAVIVSRLPSDRWPGHRLLIVAVDAETGEPRVFDRDSGVDLVDAVTASCAVPGIWPAATVRGRRYTDGGVLTIDNAELALGRGARRVVAVLPMDPENLPRPSGTFADVVGKLRAEGAEVAVFTPDEASLAAMGTNALDPATRAPAAEAGRAQGRAAVLPW